MFREIRIKATNGLLVLLFGLVLEAGAAAGFVLAVRGREPVWAAAFFAGFVLLAIALGGLLTVSPNEAKVLTLFGRYVGTVRDAGLWWGNPFYAKRRVSLLVRNFETSKLKVNDSHSNPIEIARTATRRPS